MKAKDMSPQIHIDREQIAEFCRRNRIKRLSLFGSVLTDRFNEESDVDILVEFEPGARVGYFTIGRLINELEEMLGRRVDLRTPRELSRYFRDEVVRDAELVYAA